MTKEISARSKCPRLGASAGGQASRRSNSVLATHNPRYRARNVHVTSGGPCQGRQLEQTIGRYCTRGLPNPASLYTCNQPINIPQYLPNPASLYNCKLRARVRVRLTRKVRFSRESQSGSDFPPRISKRGVGFEMVAQCHAQHRSFDAATCTPSMRNPRSFPRRGGRVPVNQPINILVIQAMIEPRLLAHKLAPHVVCVFGTFHPSVGT